MEKQLELHMLDELNEVCLCCVSTPFQSHNVYGLTLLDLGLSVQHTRDEFG